MFVTCHCDTLGSHVFPVSTFFIPKPEWMTKAFLQATCFVFAYVHCSLQFFLAILLVGIMMLSESWCFEQKVQEKDGMERDRNHSFPWSNFCMMKKDMMVVSFKLVRSVRRVDMCSLWLVLLYFQ